MVAAYIPPDSTNQVGTPYKTNLDNAIVAGARISVAFLPQAQDTPNMTVKVLAGALMIGGVLTEVAAQSTGTITAPATNPRIDRVVLNPADGTIAVVTGTPGASPVAPAIPADRLPICRFQLATSTTAIANSMIVDERVPAGAGISGGGTATVTAGEALSIRDLIYQDIFNQRSGGADRWYKVDTDATGPVRISPRLGIALAAISSGAAGSAQVRSGRVAGFSGLTAGQPVFASATAGAVTQTVPTVPTSGTQNVSRLIGYAASATEIDFDPDDDTVFTARNSALASGGTLVVEHWPDAGGRERLSAAYLVAAAPVQTQIAQGTGTAIGDMVNNGGLAAAFDGVTSQADTSSAGGGADAKPVYIGKDWGSGNTKTVTGFRVYGPNNQFIGSGAGTVTITLYGSTDNFSGSNVDLGSVAATDGNTTATIEKLSGLTTTTAYRYHRLGITTSASLGGNRIRAAEVQFFEDVAAYDEPIAPVPESLNSGATNAVTARFADASNANADRFTTFRNRTNATRDLAGEVVL